MRTALPIIACLLVGCSAVQTITPTRTNARTSSYDASTPAQYPDKTNSGVLALVRDSSGQVTHATVTASFVDRVMSLIAEYGDQLTPPIAAGRATDTPPGVTPFVDQWGNHLYRIDTQNLDRYRQLALWRKSGRAKTGTFQKLLNKI